MADVSPSTVADKAPDGRDMPLQALLDLWLSFPPRVRRSVLRGLWQRQESLAKRAVDPCNDEDGRKWAASLVRPTEAARWLLRGISKAMDPTYDMKSDGTANAETYRTHHPEASR